MSIGLLRNSQRRFLLPLNVSMSLRTRTFLAMVALLALFVPGASATCGSSAQRMVPSVSSALPLPLLQEPTSGSVLAQERQDGKEPSMTGLWKTVFVAGGAVVNLGFNTWHSDGTEWALDGTFPPAGGNVCPGVWERIGHRTYVTVHPAFNYDASNTHIVGIFL